MATIDVTPAGNDLFRVDVTDDAGTSTHEVTIPDGYADEVGAGEVSHRDLVVESFRFLLEREPKEQILGRFALSDIARYFPEYEDEIGSRVDNVSTDRQPPPPKESGKEGLDETVETEDQGPEALR